MSQTNRLMIAIEIPHLRKALSLQSSHIAGRLRKQATEEYASEGHVQIDDDALVGIQDDGLESGQVRGWVAAWVFVEVPLVEPPAPKPVPDLRKLENWNKGSVNRGQHSYNLILGDDIYLLWPAFLDTGDFYGYTASVNGKRLGKATTPRQAAYIAWEHQQETQSDADINAGRTQTFNNAAELLGHIQSGGRKIHEEGK